MRIAKSLGFEMNRGFFCGSRSRFKMSKKPKVNELGWKQYFEIQEKRGGCE